MAPEMKKGSISFVGDKPMKITDIADSLMPAATSDQKRTVNKVGKAIRAYRDAAKSLLMEKYSHLMEFAPEFLADPGDVIAVCCDGGVVIRYDKKQESSKVCSAWMQEDLPRVVAMLSQNMIQCHPSREFSSTVEETGCKTTFSIFNSTTGESRDVTTFRIGFDVVVEHPKQIPEPPHKPFCLSSVRNAIELRLLGEMLGEGVAPGDGQRFLSRSAIRLPVGWECIEIYPNTDLDYWKVEHAPVWAENDILAAVAARQFQESQFQSLDPLASARKKYTTILGEFKTLLDSRPEREESFQVFLKKYPYLLCPTQTKMWPKLRLGAKTTDFVFRDATSDYLLVELEKSTHLLFREDGHPRAPLTTAIGQIADWKRYLEDNLRTAQSELGLTGISTNPRSLVVIGRSDTLTAENERKLTAMDNEHPKLKVMTYDDVYDNAKAVIENLFGPIWDSFGETQIYYLE